MMGDNPGELTYLIKSAAPEPLQTLVLNASVNSLKKKYRRMN